MLYLSVEDSIKGTYNRTLLKAATAIKMKNYLLMAQVEGGAPTGAPAIGFLSMGVISKPTWSFCAICDALLIFKGDRVAILLPSDQPYIKGLRLWLSSLVKL